MRGRPINPNSNRQQEPWKAYGLSRAAWSYKKKYNDLPMTLLLDDVKTIKRLKLELKGYKWLPFVAGEYRVSVKTIMDVLRERKYSLAIKRASFLRANRMRSGSKHP